MNWRSPAMLPPPVEADTFVRPAAARARLALGAAWRLRGFAHALAHALRRMPGGAPSSAILRRCTLSLEASEAFVRAAAAHGVDDAERHVQARLRGEPLPWPESQAEAAVADLLYGGALDRSLEALGGSSDRALAEASRAATGGCAFGREILESLAVTMDSRPCLQLLVDRWAREAVCVFGRPGTAADDELPSSGVRPRVDELVRAHFGSLEPVLERCGLAHPDAARMGVLVFEGWTPRSRPARTPR